MVLLILYFCYVIITKKLNENDKPHEICERNGMACSTQEQSEIKDTEGESSTESNQDPQDKNMEKLSLKSFRFSRPELKKIQDKEILMKMLKLESSEEDSSDNIDEINDEGIGGTALIDLKEIKSSQADLETTQPISKEEDSRLQQEKKEFSHSQKLGNLISFLNGNHPNQICSDAKKNQNGSTGAQKTINGKKVNQKKTLPKNLQQKKAQKSTGRKEKKETEKKKQGSGEPPSLSTVEKNSNTKKEPTKNNISVDVRSSDRLSLSVPKYEIKIKPNENPPQNGPEEKTKTDSKKTQQPNKHETGKSTHLQKPKRVSIYHTNPNTNEFLDNLNQKWKRIREDNRKR